MSKLTKSRPLSQPRHRVLGNHFLSPEEEFLNRKNPEENNAIELKRNHKLFEKLNRLPDRYFQLMVDSYINQMDIEHLTLRYGDNAPAMVREANIFLELIHRGTIDLKSSTVIKMIKDLNDVIDPNCERLQLLLAFYIAGDESLIDVDSQIGAFGGGVVRRIVNGVENLTELSQINNIEPGTTVKLDSDAIFKLKKKNNGITQTI